MNLVVTSFQEGWTPLIWAAQNGHQDVVEVLILAGANLETPDRTVLIRMCCDFCQSQATALRKAAERGQGEMVSALITAGANLEAADMVCSFLVMRTDSMGTLPWHGLLLRAIRRWSTCYLKLGPIVSRQRRYLQIHALRHGGRLVTRCLCLLPRRVSLRVSSC